MKKVLIANRGEIAVRMIRACREMGLSPVAVYSECDRDRAPRPLCRRGASHWSERRRATATCASIACIDAAKASGADAVHPGYGFLAENAGVRRGGRRRRPHLHRSDRRGAIETMGSKTAARTAAIRAGVPVVPGTEEPLARDAGRRHRRASRRRSATRCSSRRSPAAAARACATVTDPADLSGAVRAARSEAQRRLRRRVGVSRAAADAAAPHRSAAARRRPRHRACRSSSASARSSAAIRRSSRRRRRSRCRRRCARR